MRTHTADPRASPRTLVLYVFHQSSEWYKENLRFFLHEAMLPEHDSETVDYMLVINGETELPLDELLDALPAYHQYENFHPFPAVLIGAPGPTWATPQNRLTCLHDVLLFGARGSV